MSPWSLWAKDIFSIFEVRIFPSIYDFGLEGSFLYCDLGRQASLATRARKRELSIQEGRIENDSDQKFSKTKFFQSFSENHFFPRFMSPWSLWAKDIFSIFEVRIFPSIYDFGLEGSFLYCDLGRQASLATRARKRELSIQEGRIENDSDQKFSENHFFPRFMSPWSLWAESIFSIFEVRTRGFPYYVRQCPLMSVQVRQCPSMSANVRPSPPMSVYVRQCPKKHVRCLIESKKDRT